jgi:phosphatidate cytidylyltransferase
VFLLTNRAHPAPVAAAALAIMACGYGLVYMREMNGVAAVLWVLGVVITSDVAGYFAGRILGGPKFWPAISPKKTWSGTVAGWICAAALGGAFYAAGYGSALLIAISPVIAFAGQMGDIGESWLKRRAGIKDSSHLIPGHGGVLDRFDAVIGATVAVIILDVLTPFWV